jgi:ABC-type oligopeptide transport system substrate-binding subunit/tetratricopeptide (TPR) repeat protein
MAEQVFVARQRELTQLQTFLDRALAGQGQVAFVTGEAGSGKTALVTEFARRAQDAHPDLLVAIGQGDAQTGVGDPYLPFREVMGLLTGDVEAKLAQGAITQENAERLKDFLRVSGQVLVDLGPELIGIFVPGAGLAAKAGAFLAGKVGWLDKLERLTERKAAGPGETDPLAGSGQVLDQSHIFEQYTDVLLALAARQPLLLILDDLQWADAASINLLFRLGRRISDSRILMLGAYRPDEVALGRPSTSPGRSERHPLEKVLAELKRYHGDIWIDLGEAEEIEGWQFVDAFLDTEPNRLGEGFRQALLRHTGGHPLFTIELLREMQERGDLIEDEGRWVEGPALDWGALPARVEGVIEERIGRLEEDLRDILTVAAVEGENFTAQVVGRVQEVQERRLLRSLSQELDKRHHLVREQGEVKVDRRLLSRYRFSHAVFQRYLYNDLSSGERRLLHGEIAEVLEELYAGRTEEIAVQLARHYAEAGEGEKAVEYLLEAGDQAQGLHAHQEAIKHYERALVFLRELGDDGRTARTLMKLGLTYHTAFRFEQARRAYEEGFTLWERAGVAQPAIPPPPAPHALRVDWPDPWTLDPTLAIDIDSSRVIDQLFSGLVEMTPGMTIVPGVARTWEVLEGGRTYVFHLRDDVRWSDGMPVTAGDFEYTWKRVLDPATESPNASLLYDARGARAFHEGEVSDPEHVAVRGLDDVTLTVELERPTSYFLHLLAHPSTYPVPRHVVEAHGASWTEVENIVTNGPFRLESWQRGKSIRLARNPEYHGRFMGNVQRVELCSLPLKEWSTRLGMYETGSLDILHLRRIPPVERDRARQQHASEYVSLPSSTTYYLVFDVRRPPFDDPWVRRAFVCAVDRVTMVDVAMRGYDFPAAGGLVPPGMPGHSPGIGLPYDPELGRRLLAEAGFPGGRGFPIVHALTLTDIEPAFDHLQKQWHDNLGLEITWETMELAELDERILSNPPALFSLCWVADYPDPDSFLRVAVQLHTRWRNEVFVDLVERARRVPDQGERMKLYGQADRILVEEAPIMPLGYEREHLLVKPWVRKYLTSALKLPFWKDVIIEPH